MIKTFAQPWLEAFYYSGRHKQVSTSLARVLLRKLDMLNRAAALKDLKSPPANHLHPLHGKRKGEWAISVNGPWRLCFTYHEGNVYNLELVQYH